MVKAKRFEQVLFLSIQILFRQELAQLGGTQVR